jgi:hypothetical protein
MNSNPNLRSFSDEELQKELDIRQTIRLRKRISPSQRSALEWLESKRRGRGWVRAMTYSRYRHEALYDCPRSTWYALEKRGLVETRDSESSFSVRLSNMQS